MSPILTIFIWFGLRPNECYLKVIDISREIEMEQKAVIYDGCTYVPLSFFKEFINDADIEDSLITVAPGMAELAG